MTVKTANFARCFSSYLQIWKEPDWTQVVYRHGLKQSISSKGKSPNYEIV